MGDWACEPMDTQRRDEPLAHHALRREIAHVKELVALRIARQHPQVDEEIRVGLLLAPGHSHTSGVNTARYSNSPLSSGTCVGCRAAHAEHCSRVSSPRRIAATRWAGVICHSARSRASRAFKASRIWSIRRLWLMVTLSVWLVVRAPAGARTVRPRTGCPPQRRRPPRRAHRCPRWM